MVSLDFDTFQLRSDGFFIIQTNMGTFIYTAAQSRPEQFRRYLMRFPETPREFLGAREGKLPLVVGQSV